MSDTTDSKVLKITRYTYNRKLYCFNFKSYTTVKEVESYIKLFDGFECSEKKPNEDERDITLELLSNIVSGNLLYYIGCGDKSSPSEVQDKLLDVIKGKKVLKICEA